MTSPTGNCTTLPLFKGMTQLFLNNFGTNTIPDGYVQDDNYGPKTKKQNFAELFKVFYILIVVAVLCVLVFLLLILFLIWYYKRRNYVSESCRKTKCWTMLITTLLLLSLLLSAFGLYIAFRNILDMQKIYTKSQDTQDNRFDKIGKGVSKILDNDYEKLKNDAVSSCKNSDLLKDIYPATTKVRKMSKAYLEIFKDYMQHHVMPAFDFILLQEDIFRMFSRNYSAYIGVGRIGKVKIGESRASVYEDYMFSLYDWSKIYNCTWGITLLMPYYAITAESNLRMSRVCSRIQDYFDEISMDVRQQRNFINKKVKTLFQETIMDHDAPYKFGYIICIIAIVVLAIFLIVLLCTLCLRFRAMIKPLIFLFIILTLIFILMAFVTFYHFFYGVIEYNGLCKENSRKTKTRSFSRMMNRRCTNNQNVYTLLKENRWINTLSDWNTIDESEILDNCKDTCTPLDRVHLSALYETVSLYPKENFCSYKGVDKAWLKVVNDKHKEYENELFNFDPSISYYWRRVNKTYCMLNLAKQGQQLPTPQTQQKFIECITGYTIGKRYVDALKPALDEISGMCKKTIDSCSAYIRELPKIANNVAAFQIKAEEQLKLLLGPCDDALSTSKAKRTEYCNCDSYILNGVWVGSLLFLLGTLLALLLLPCLLCLFIKCGSGDRLLSRRAPTHSIHLPAITIPKHVINSLQADPRVKYKVKKIN